MISMFHMDKQPRPHDALLRCRQPAAHAGQRLARTARPSPSAFVDGTNMQRAPRPATMDHLVITMPDADHHTEDWTFVQEDGQPMKEHFELARVKAAM